MGPARRWSRRNLPICDAIAVVTGSVACPPWPTCGWRSALRHEPQVSGRVSGYVPGKNIEPHRSFSGKFDVRLEPRDHAAAVFAAAAEGKSLNEWVSDTIKVAAAA